MRMTFLPCSASSRAGGDAGEAVAADHRVAVPFLGEIGHLGRRRHPAGVGDVVDVHIAGRGAAALSMWPPSSVLAVLSPPAGAQPASPAAPAAMAATAPMPMNERRDMPLVVFSIVPISSLGIGAYRSACTEARRCGRAGRSGRLPGLLVARLGAAPGPMMAPRAAREESSAWGISRKAPSRKWGRWK